MSPRKRKSEITGLLTIQQAQDKLQCSRSKIYLLGHAGRLELVKFDRSTRVTERSMQKLIDDLIEHHGTV